jgi:hypothetical protein
VRVRDPRDVSNGPLALAILRGVPAVCPEPSPAADAHFRAGSSRVNSGAAIGSPGSRPKVGGRGYSTSGRGAVCFPPMGDAEARLLAEIRQAIADLEPCLKYPGASTMLKDLQAWLDTFSEDAISLESLRPLLMSMREPLLSCSDAPVSPALARNAERLLSLIDRALKK